MSSADRPTGPISALMATMAAVALADSWGKYRKARPSRPISNGFLGFTLLLATQFFGKEGMAPMSSSLKCGAAPELRRATSCGTWKLASLRAWSRRRIGALRAISKAVDTMLATSLDFFGPAAIIQEIGGMGRSLLERRYLGRSKASSMPPATPRHPVTMASEDANNLRACV